MSEEQAAAGGEEAGKSEQKEEKSSKQEASHDDGELQVLREKAKRFDAFQQRALKDENFKSVVEGAWNGKKYQEFVENRMKQDQATDDPEEALRRDLMSANQRTEELAKMTKELKDTYDQDKVDYITNQIGGRYQSEFDALAAKHGYEPGTEAYDILFDNVKSKTYNVARKRGHDDFLLNYKSGLMKQAFEEAFEIHKKAGFDEAWRNRQKILADKKKQENKPKNPMDVHFEKNKDLMKTREGRRKAINDYFTSNFVTPEK
jgi:hypothetical protein